MHVAATMGSESQGSGPAPQLAVVGGVRVSGDYYGHRGPSSLAAGSQHTEHLFWHGVGFPTVATGARAYRAHAPLGSQFTAWSSRPSSPAGQPMAWQFDSAQDSLPAVYVSASGGSDDPSCGLEGAPCATLSYAVNAIANAVQPVGGMVDVIVGGGVYNTTDACGARATRPLNISGAGSSTTTMDCRGMSQLLGRAGDQQQCCRVGNHNHRWLHHHLRRCP
jgi:hypothetical protein